MKLLILLAVIAAASCNVIWDKSGQYDLVDDMPLKYRLVDPLLRLRDIDDIYPFYPWRTVLSPEVRAVDSPFIYSYKQVVRD